MTSCFDLWNWLLTSSFVLLSSICQTWTQFKKTLSCHKMHLQFKMIMLGCSNTHFIITLLLLSLFSRFLLVWYEIANQNMSQFIIISYEVNITIIIHSVYQFTCDEVAFVFPSFIAIATSSFKQNILIDLWCIQVMQLYEWKQIDTYMLLLEKDHQTVHK